MAATNTKLRIAVVPGDGIGREILPPAVHILGRLQSALGGFTLDFDERRDAGAAYYAETGRDISRDAFEATRRADAILLGAIGLPSVRHPDGTEISPHLRMREEFGLYAGVRPVKAYPNTPRRLLDERAKGTLQLFRKQAQLDGMRTLLQDGIEKVLAGHTDFKQVRSVCIK